MKLKDKITITKTTVYNVEEIVNDLLFGAEMELDLILLESPDVDILFREVADKLTEKVCLDYLKRRDEIDAENGEERNSDEYELAGEIMVNLGFTEDVLRKYSL